MISSSSHDEGNYFQYSEDVSDLDHKNSFERIETLEQSLIQHIRTAGLRKPRECSLIDDVMNLRKDRRQTFTNLFKYAELLKEQNRSLKKKITSISSTIDNEVSNV